MDWLLYCRLFKMLLFFGSTVATAKNFSFILPSGDPLIDRFLSFFFPTNYSAISPAKRYISSSIGASTLAAILWTLDQPSFSF
jgi:hypothetical protein